MVIMIMMIVSIMIMTDFAYDNDNDDDDDDDHVHPVVFNIRFCWLPIVLHKIFCVYSVYILFFWLGASENSSIPANCAQKTENAPPST